MEEEEVHRAQAVEVVATQRAGLRQLLQLLEGSRHILELPELPELEVRLEA